MFERGGNAKSSPLELDVKSPRTKIGKLVLEKDFFTICGWQGGISERKALMTKQAALPRISRGSICDERAPVGSTANLELILRLDELRLELPHRHGLRPAGRRGEQGRRVSSPR